ncbi:MAG: pyruvate kinase [Myxococcota bacterium]
MALRYDPGHLARLQRELEVLRDAAKQLERSHHSDLSLIPDAYRDSARNLIHYTAIRQHDIRALQRDLHALGLSSLGRMEAYVLASLDAVLAALRRMQDEDVEVADVPVSFVQGRVLLRAHTDTILGPTPARRTVRIMVTMGAEAAEGPELLQELLLGGMNVMRINCSKDEPEVWKAQVANLRRAERHTGLRAQVMFDLSGPNPRSGRLTESDDHKPVKIRLAPGDRLEVWAEPITGTPPRFAEDGSVLEPARISCSLPEILQDLNPGDRFYLDDGAAAGRVVHVLPDRAVIEITDTLGGPVKLKAAKGMNFPDSDLRLPSLTEKDRRDLEAIVREADLISLSFVRRPSDVDELVEVLDQLEANVGLILKIETVKGFDRLPRLLLHALRRPPVGIMVARGDMGVELGFDRLAEAQEEVLWLCEAAHVPTIWATQVLESLTKTGHPSRAEVTDAAMAGRAECVMLNRGEYIGSAVRFLSNILERMEAHQFKKLALMRKLSISTHI